ncbi:aminotransferase class I/II-fold pyridoxal phosphate-dependent enzyme [Gryllotalpicola kribbensis]|uniref:Aminotransferase class I/II-fold pyridoxal phosphate-dependent enzyme n=1 Tax=Gryllotalpicola kribbensis TaxID=993084 RepID=A0ABP8AVZ8_9MICO
MLPRPDDTSPRGIAAAIARQISAGELAPGERLPTVRELAAAYGVSPATVSHAWQTLLGAGLIVARGRAGSFVRDQGATDASWLPRSMAELAGDAPVTALDLSRGTPDAALLPELQPVVARIAWQAGTGSYQELPVIPELHRLLRESWPYPVEALTVIDGALDGLSRTLDQVVRFGDRVAVEVPGFPPLFEMLDAHGVERVPLEVDASGVTARSLFRALAREVSAVVLQPRAHNPTGASLTPQRAEELARIIAGQRRGASVIVIEDDHSGLISTAPPVSLGTWLPNQVVHLRSFSKSHGPDLRIAALGGPRPLVDRLVARRLLGPGWTSRMLQTVLLELLRDPLAVAEVGRARAVYAERQAALAAALAASGAVAPTGDGINVWLRVRDERRAVAALGEAGVRVAAGLPFMADAPGSPAIRVTVGALPVERAAHVAALLAPVVT